MCLFEREACAAILHRDACAGNHDARAPALVVRLDERDHVAVFVRCTKQNGAAGLRWSVLEILRLCRIDLGGEFGEIRAREQILGLHSHRGGVANLTVHFAKRELHRLGGEMHAVGAVGREIGETRIRPRFIENSSHHLRGDALAIGRNRKHCGLPKRRLQWRGPARLVGGKVVLIEKSAVVARGVGDALGDFAGVKRGALSVGDQLERARVIGEHHAFGGVRRATVGGEHPLPLGKFCEFRIRARPQVRRARRDEVAVACMANRRFEQLRKRELAEALPQRNPTRHRARHRDRTPAALGHADLPIERAAQLPRRRTAGGVEANDLTAKDSEDKSVAADPVGRRFEHGHCRGRCHSRISRGSSAAQHLHPRLRRKWLAGRNRHRAAHRRTARVVREIPVDRG